MERPLLPGEAGPNALVVHLGCERRNPFRARNKPEPHHSHGAAAAEGTHGPQAELEGSGQAFGQRAGHRIDELERDSPDESDREVEIFGGRPPEVGSDPGARIDEAPNLFALGFGYRQPEEGAHRQRRVFFQFS